MATCAESSLKWTGGWRELMQNSYDKAPHDAVLARRVCVPIVAAIAVALVLVVLAPPFACAPADGVTRPRLAPARVAAWALVGGALTAALASTGLFKRTG